MKKTIYLLCVIIILNIIYVGYIAMHNYYAQTLSFDILDDSTVIVNNKEEYNYNNSLNFLNRIWNMNNCTISSTATNTSISCFRIFIERADVHPSYINTGKLRIPITYGFYRVNYGEKDVVICTIRITDSCYVFNKENLAYNELDEIVIEKPCVLQIVCNYDSMYVDLIRLLDFVAENNNIKEIYIIMNG